MRLFDESRVFAHFAEISKYPRESGNEKAVSDYIKNWADGLGFYVVQDDLWNLIIKKPASAGNENREAVILQAHLDMVCEKHSDSTHDFTKDPIELLVDGDWLHATDTTLGADNGIGVAIAMAVLEDDTLSHPPLEVVFTVQEETTFAGAAGVDKSGLEATCMINLDHAVEHQIIVGSCGGTGVNFLLPVSRMSEIPPGFSAFQISLKGLKGGHSGEDIHRGRGNAIMMMLRLVEGSGARLVSLNGGTNRLAIPREASAVVVCEDEGALRKAVEETTAILRKEYHTAPGLSVSVEPVSASLPPLTEESFNRFRSALRAYPNGIVNMSGDMEGIVESSDNVGIVETGEDSVKMVSEIRGAFHSTVQDILETIKSIAVLTSATVESFAPYVPWEFHPDSPFRELAVRTYEELYGETMEMLAVHAGLECGFFVADKPDLDIIAIGPDCENFHAPEERVSISSAERVFRFLKELLAHLCKGETGYEQRNDHRKRSDAG